MRFFKSITIILILTVGAGVTRAQTAEVNVSTGHFFLSAPFLLANHLGYFEDEGLTVNFQKVESGRTALTNMLNGSDIDLVFAAQTPVVYHSFGHDDFLILGGISFSYQDVMILTLKNGGIKSIADLKGKNIGLTKLSISQAYLSLLLTHNLILKSDVTLTAVLPEDAAKALTEGRVDAMASWAPNVLQAQALLKDRLVILPTPNIYREDFYVVANRNFVRENPETIQKFLKALLRAEDYMANNREEAIAATAQMMGLEREGVASVWNNYRYGLFFDQNILINLEDEARWMIREGLTKKAAVPNYLDFIDTAPLWQLKPEAVTVY